MRRSGRDWTAAIAQCALNRAQPVLAHLMPQPFARVDLARALAQTGVMPDRETAFATDLWPKMADVLGPDAVLCLSALRDLPLNDADSPAAAFWRVRFRDLPDLAIPGWTAFAQVFRGRPETAPVPDWLAPVAADLQRHREVTLMIAGQSALPLTAQDRSLYVRFGWNDAGDVPGLTGLSFAAALLRARSAWQTVSHHFDAVEIEAAAADQISRERSAGMATLDADARRHGVSRDDLAAALYPVRTVPPLADILNEAAHADH